MRSVLVHPLWWALPQKLAFLIAVSDRVEGEDRAVSSQLQGTDGLSYTSEATNQLQNNMFVRQLRPALLMQEDRTMYQALECCAEDAIGPGGSWAAVLDSGLVNNLGEFNVCIWLANSGRGR